MSTTGYQVVVNVTQVERLSTPMRLFLFSENKKSSTPKYRFFTDTGIYLSGEEPSGDPHFTQDPRRKTGPATLVINGDKVIGWLFA